MLFNISPKWNNLFKLSYHDQKRVKSKKKTLTKTDYFKILLCRYFHF